MIEMGDTGKDKITGFKGVMTSRQIHLTGCDNVYLQPPINKDGTLPKGEWFDETMVIIVKKAPNNMFEEKEETKKVGGPSLIPPRTVDRKGYWI